MSTPPAFNTPMIEELRRLTGKRWEQLRLATESAAEARATLEKGVSSGLVSSDTALIVYGSLARGERTKGSDCDWTLLVDGQANGDHHAVAAAIEKAVEVAGLGKPGPTGVFGSLSFSHELVHQIGGDEDTNRNTTRRILLLLESAAITPPCELVRERVVRQLIQRYLTQDREKRLPRFLLNDIVRYWRTVAVDYARKIRDRHSKEWALKNVKLRLSRKLTFVSGVLACFECYLRPSETLAIRATQGDPKTTPIGVQEQLFENINSTPLETLARAIVLYASSDEKRVELADKLLGSYNTFLGFLNDERKKEVLKKLEPEREDDPVFQEGRAIGHEFQRGLLELFFSTDDRLTKTTQEYGVF